jgi:hypothetical protein
MVSGLTRITWGLAVALVASGCIHDGGRELTRQKAQLRSGRPTGTGVSIICLIANPQAWDGKRVLVQGYMMVGRQEGGAVLYLSREDARHGIGKNSLALDFEERQWETGFVKTLDRKWVIIEGVFDETYTGHLDTTAGGIRTVTLIKQNPW